MTPASGMSVCYCLTLFSSHSFAILSTHELCPELTFFSVLGINSVFFWHLGMFFITKYLGYIVSLPYFSLTIFIKSLQCPEVVLYAKVCWGHPDKYGLILPLRQFSSWRGKRRLQTQCTMGRAVPFRRNYWRHRWRILAQIRSRGKGSQKELLWTVNED